MVIEWTAEDLVTLKAAITSGIQTVTFGGNGSPTRTVTYQSTADMWETVGKIEAALAAQAGTRRKFRYAATKKGFE